MKAWWQTLAQRDQRVLILGGAFLVVVLLYAYVWMPVSQGVQAAYSKVSSQKTNLVWMQHAVRRIDDYRKKGYVPTQAHRTPLKVAVNEAIRAERLKVYVTGTQYAGKKSDPDGVTLDFNAVPFDRVIHMLQGLWIQDGVYISELKVSRTKTSGLVAAQLSLLKMS